MRKTATMRSPGAQQDVSLYYRENKIDNTPSPKIQIAFSAENSSGTNASNTNQSSGYSSSYSSFEPNFSTPSSQQQSSTNFTGQVLQCNVALHIQNGQKFSPDIAKQHMASLVTMVAEIGLGGRLIGA